MNKCEAGLDDRGRDTDGEIRRKWSDTKVATLREEYGSGFAEGFCSDARFGTVLDRTGARSLSDLIKHR